MYISRASGNDSWSCDQSKPCKTISRAVELASSGDHILLDGSNTDKDPYNCQSRSPEHSGVQINNSLSIMGYGSPMPHIQCNKGEGLQFNGSDNKQQMRVALSRLLVSQGSIMVQDSSVHIDRCRFESSKGVVINIRSRLSLNILVTNSIFYNNSACVSVVVNSTKKQSKNIQVVFKMTNSSFLFGNVVKDMGKCISFTKSQTSSQPVSSYITLEHTTFTGNKFILPQGLIFLEINNGSQNIQFESVTFFDNGVSSTREDLKVDSVLCIVRGTDVTISIGSSKFSSEYAKLLNGSAEDISFHIYNSTFHGHRGRNNGGVISLQGTNLCKLNVSKSSFVNTSAVVGMGGAISIECATIDCVSLNQNNFTSNTASMGGGALYIKAVKASVKLRHSAFTNCETKELMMGVGGSGVLIDTSLKSLTGTVGNDLLLTVDSCRFERCVTSSRVNGGSVAVFYKSQIEININNSNFISNLNGAVILRSWPYFSESTGNNGSMKSSYVRIQNSRFFENDGIFPPLDIYVNDQSIVTLLYVSMESNTVLFSRGGVVGGAACIHSGNLTIQQCQFLKNRARFEGGALVVIVNLLNITDSFFDDNRAVLFLGRGGALSVAAMSAVIFNTTFNNCSATYGGAICAYSCGKITIRKSQFVENNAGEQDPQVSVGGGGATFSQHSQVTFEETMFQRNTGLLGGTVYLQNGGATFKNCYAVDNFAAVQGGFLYAAYGVKNVVIQDSVLNQTKSELRRSKFSYKKPSFISGHSLELLTIHNTTMEATPYDSNGPLLLVTNVTVMDFGKDNSTSLNCPAGSKMEILNYTLGDKDNSPCFWQFTCSPCAENSYSLQRGRAVGVHAVPGFQCLPCPFGANCSQNIIAKPNFWGFKEQTTPPTLKFTICPVGFCSPPNETEFPKYNGCQGNRTGKLCGHCSDAYSETLYSTTCRSLNECNDYWFWPLSLVYVSLIAFYLTFKPPITPWIMRQIKWFKTHEMGDEERNSDEGYVKIIFYFYQAADLLLASNTSLVFVEGKLKDILVGVFNFRQSFSSNGLICPFPGLTVVTKQLFSAYQVFGTSLMIGVLYSLHRGAQRCRGKEAPSFSPYMAGILQTMLLGYKTLASVSFNLLRCVPIGSEKRLFLDGNLVCFLWWQYILIALVFAFFVPFVFVLFWGCYKLHNGSLSVAKFLLACCFPLPFLLYWLILFLLCIKRNAAHVDSATRKMSKRSVEMTLFGCFKRPAEGSTLSLGWESVMIGRRLILILLKTFVSDPMPRLLIMSFLCVLFLLHHAISQPFRDVTANNLETISLLSLVLLGMANMFFASFVSLAVALTDHFQF